MMKSKIYAQISDFDDINHKIKVHTLPPYYWETIGSLAFC